MTPNGCQVMQKFCSDLFRIHCNRGHDCLPLQLSWIIDYSKEKLWFFIYQVTLCQQTGEQWIVETWRKMETFSWHTEIIRISQNMWFFSKLKVKNTSGLTELLHNYYQIFLSICLIFFVGKNSEIRSILFNEFGDFNPPSKKVLK